MLVEHPEIDSGGNAALTLSGPWGLTEYVATTKSRLTSEGLGLVVAQMKKLEETARQRPLLMTAHIGPAMAERLRSEGIDYVDTAGNMSLRRTPLYVWSSGLKSPRKLQRPSRAFQATGLKLVMVLLADPEAVGRTHRELAEGSGISLGFVGEVLKDLRAAGYLRAAGRKKQVLSRRKELLQRWELGYAELLRPKIALARARLPGGKPVQTLAVEIARRQLGETILVGGELGAELLTGHLRASRATLHVPEGQMSASLAGLRLIRDPAGEVEIVARFGKHDDWKLDAQPQIRLAHPLLVHAELLTAGVDSRLREAADLVLQQHLSGLLGLDGEEAAPR